MRRSVHGSPLSGGDDAAGDLPPELMQQLFGGPGLLTPAHGAPLAADRAADPASCAAAASRGAHLGTCASAPVRLHATSGRAAAEFPPLGAPLGGPKFAFAGFTHGPRAGSAGPAPGGSSRADSAGGSGSGTRRSQILTGPAALGGLGTPGGGTPGGPARMGTSSPDTPSGGAGGAGGSGRAGARAASARTARTAPEPGGWAEGERGTSPLQRSTSSNSLQNLGAAGARACVPNPNPTLRLPINAWCRTHGLSLTCGSVHELWRTSGLLCTSPAALAWRAVDA